MVKENAGDSKFLREQRIREFKAMPLDILAEFAYELDLGWKARNKEIEKLTAEIEKKSLLVGEKDRVIEELKRKKNPTYKFEGYDKSKTGVEKLVFILTRAKQRMAYNQLKDTLLLLEPELREQWADVNRAVTDLLNKACRYEAIVKSKIYGNHGHYCYSLPTFANPT